MSTVAIPAVDCAPLLERCFLFEATEGAYDIERVTGKLPAWLRGTYYVNGPARFERAGLRMKHWLDGDGMVCALRFTESGIRFTNRFVQTAKLKDETAAGRFLYRSFGTSFEGDRLRRKLMLEPPVNVSVYSWAGKLLVFGEQCLPLELDPVTLETRGDFDFWGDLNEVSPFAAHAKVDPLNGNMLNFGVSFSATEPMLNVYEFDPAGGMVRRRRHRMAAQHALHDFGFTPNHVVFYLGPMLMNFQRFLGEGLSVMESLEWRPELATSLLIAPRTSKAEAFTIRSEAAYCLHFINCFERDGLLTVDVLEMDRPIYAEYQTVPDLFCTAPHCRPVRFVIDLQSRSLKEKHEIECGWCPDFPSPDPALAGEAYSDFWMLGIGACGQPGRKFFDRLVHGSWGGMDLADVWVAPAGQYLGGEPVYIPNPSNEKEGVIVLQGHIPAENRCEYQVFNAWDVRSGPVARLPLAYPIHPGFHASFHAE